MLALCVVVYAPNPYTHIFQPLSHLTDVDKIWYGCYAIGGHPKLIIFNLLQSVVT
jgi:hypothetical protein